MQACGAKHRILEEDVDGTDVDDVVVALVNMAKRVSFTFIMESFCGTLNKSSVFFFLNFLLLLSSSVNKNHNFPMKDNN